MRVLSLIASSTEIICALGAENLLVGRSHECDFPPSVKALPCVTRPKLNPDDLSAKIHARVNELLLEGLSIYHVDAEAVRSLAPDLIITQDHCEVCAVSLKDVERAACTLMTQGTKVVSLHPDSLADVLRDIRAVADALLVPERGHALAAAMESGFASLKAHTAPLTPKPRVVCLEWLSPLMASGNWLPELVEIAGGIPLFAHREGPPPIINVAQLNEANPDVIVCLPCGFDLERTLREARETLPEEFFRLRAFQEGRCYAVDGNQYMNRPGPRLLDSARILSEIFYPDKFSWNIPEGGWRVIKER